MRIADIIIGDRHRKSMGDIDALARSIAKVGLLQPILVKPDGNLIAGARRLAACKLLGLADIPVTVATNLDDAILALTAERDENTCRENFAPSEAIEIGKRLEALERPKAEDRMMAGVPSSDSDEGTGRTDDTVAAAVGMKRDKYRKAKKVVEEAQAQPDLLAGVVEAMDASGNVNAAAKEVERRKREAERAAMAAAAADLPESDRWHVAAADIATYQTTERFDFIITDPPYERGALPLYGALARRACEWLKPSGLLVVMCGQSYLPDIYRALSEHLAYYWTACYLTPGQPTPLRQRQVNTSWKPILVYGKPDYHGKIFGDVFKSDGNDKAFHDWGQSVSGMSSLIQQMCLPGQSILDPFLGAGTTGVAAIAHGCLFHGIDVDEQKVLISRKRLSEAM